MVFPMTVKVYQFWNGKEATIREVKLNEDSVEDNMSKVVTHDQEGVRMGLLNAVYHYGQNEVQQQNCPSVSVGDIIQLPFDGSFEFWVVANQGFENYGREKHFLLRPGN